MRPPLCHPFDYPALHLVQCCFRCVGFHGGGERFATGGAESMVLVRTWETWSPVPSRRR